MEPWNMKHRLNSRTLAEYQNIGGIIRMPQNSGTGEHRWYNKTTPKSATNTE